MRWFLLIATLISVYMTLETLGVIERLKENPIKFAELLLGKKNSFPKNYFSNDLRTFLENKTIMWALTLSISVTLFLLKATYEAFFN